MLGLLALAAGAAITAGEVAQTLMTVGSLMVATQTIVDGVKDLSDC